MYPQFCFPLRKVCFNSTNKTLTHISIVYHLLWIEMLAIRHPEYLQFKEEVNISMKCVNAYTLDRASQTSFSDEDKKGDSTKRANCANSLKSLPMKDLQCLAISVNIFLIRPDVGKAEMRAESSAHSFCDSFAILARTRYLYDPNSKVCKSSTGMHLKNHLKKIQL